MTDLLRLAKNKQEARSKALLESSNVIGDDYEFIKLYMENGWNDVLIYLVNNFEIDLDFDQHALLRYALDTKDRTLLKLLINRNITWEYGNCVLVWAAALGYDDIIQLLIDRGADPATDNNSPIKIASHYGYTQVVSILLKCERIDPTTDNNYAVKTALYNGHYDIANILLLDKRVERSLDNTGKIKAQLNKIMRWMLY